VRKCYFCVLGPKLIVVDKASKAEGVHSQGWGRAFEPRDSNNLNISAWLSHCFFLLTGFLFFVTLNFYHLVFFRIQRNALTAFQGHLPKTWILSSEGRHINLTELFTRCYQSAVSVILPQQY